MLGCSRRAARVLRAGVVVAGSIVGLAACGGGSDDVKTFTLEVRDGDDVTDLYTRGIIQAVDLCSGDSGLVRAEWTFDEDDVDKPVVQQYTKPGQGAAGPQAIDCASVPRNPDGSPVQRPSLDTAPDAEEEPTEEEAPEATTSVPAAPSSTIAR